MKKSIFVFIDGIGIGRPDDNNPFYTGHSRIFNYYQDDFKDLNKLIIKKGCLFSLDAGLGVHGLPQSATGQSAIFTGVNTPRLLKKHLFGFPNKELRKLLFHNNLLLFLKQKGLSVEFHNCYPGFADELTHGCLKVGREGEFIYSERNELIQRAVKMISVTTIMALSIRQRFHNLQDLVKGKTIYQEFTNILLQKKFPDVPVFSPQQSAHILLDRLSDMDFILYEYFQTDKAGHKQDKDFAREIVSNLDIFISELVMNLDRHRVNLFITSDHGNFEDLGSNKHTLNKVPFFVYAEQFPADDLHSLVDIYPFVIRQVLA